MQKSSVTTLSTGIDSVKETQAFEKRQIQITAPHEPYSMVVQYDEYSQEEEPFLASQLIVYAFPSILCQTPY